MKPEELAEKLTALHDALAKVAGLEEWVDNLKHDKAVLIAVVRENHEWHQAYTDLDAYGGSALEQSNLRGLSLETLPTESPQ